MTFMITVAEALAIVLERTPEPEPVVVPLDAALGCVLAEDVAADLDIPPFPRCAMDGYAVRAADTAASPVELEVIEEVQAGQVPARRVGPGQATRIMTGAPLPEGADADIPVELSESLDGGRRVRLLGSVSAGANVAAQGYEVRRGEGVLRRGRWLGSAEMGVLATFGRAQVRVFRKPTAAVLATGNELVAVSETPQPGQIRNSNESTLVAQLAGLRVEARSLGVGRDNLQDLEARIAAGLESDFLFLTGGVSMGDYDFSKEVFRRLGIAIHFEKLKMKPAKPTVFGTRDRSAVFGLPGNPVSAFVAFENLGRPALLRRMGLAPALCASPRLQASLTSDLDYRSDRETYFPARVEWRDGGAQAEVLRLKGSADIVGFSRGNALAVFPIGEKRFRKGEPVVVQLIDHFPFR